MLRDILIEKKLSNREAEVAELVSQGLSNKEVANRLFVTEKTVKFHLTNIYKKMEVKSRAQLIVWCMPHTHFVNSQDHQNEVNQEQVQQQTSQQEARPVNTIPAGSRTVGSSFRNLNYGKGSGNNVGNGGSIGL